MLMKSANDMDAIIGKTKLLEPMETLKITTRSESRFEEISSALKGAGWNVWVSAFPDKVFSRNDGAIVVLEYIGININEL